MHAPARYKEGAPECRGAFSCFPGEVPQGLTGRSLPSPAPPAINRTASAAAAAPPTISKLLGRSSLGISACALGVVTLSPTNTRARAAVMLKNLNASAAYDRLQPQWRAVHGINFGHSEACLRHESSQCAAELSIPARGVRLLSERGPLFLPRMADRGNIARMYWHRPPRIWREYPYHSAKMPDF